jgi:hypothetical protein
MAKDKRHYINIGGERLRYFGTYQEARNWVKQNSKDGTWQIYPVDRSGMGGVRQPTTKRRTCTDPRYIHKGGKSK